MSASGLGSKAAATLGSILDYLGARSRLFVIEAKEARNGLLLKLALFVAGGFFLLLAWLGFAVGIFGFITIKLEWPWPWAAVAVGGAHLLVGGILLLLAKQKFANPVFEESVREFQHERSWLNSHREQQNNEQDIS
ncbi:MAG: phage holin family protein [Verrucomicrobiales bacterium]